MATNATSIDSELTSLRYAVESTPCVLPTAPKWQEVGLRSYSGDFGQTIESVSNKIIGGGRSSIKGRPTRKTVAAGFEIALQQYNLQPLLPGFFYAYAKEAGTTDPLRTSSTDAKVTGVAADGYDGTGFTAANKFVKPGNSQLLVFARGFALSANNGLKRVTAVTATKLTVAGLVLEATPPAAAALEVVGVYQQGGTKAQFDVTSDVVTLTVDGIGGGGANEVVPGEIIFIGSDTTADNFVKSGDQVNIGFGRVGSVGTGTIVLDWTTFDPEDITSNSASVEVYIPTRSFYDRIAYTDLRRTTYQFERLVGYHDEEQSSSVRYPTPQSQVVKGCYANQLDFTIPSADLVTVTATFMGRAAIERTGAADNIPNAGDKAEPPISYTGTTDNALPLDVSETYNSTWDMIHNSLYIASGTGSTNRTKLFAYGIDGSISLQNNTTAKEGYGVFGPIVVTAGDFVVSISLNVLFTDVSVIRSIERGDSVGLYFVLARENSGMVVDLPNLTVASGALAVASGEPVMISLTNEANRSRFGHAAMISFFDYLPAIAYAGDRSVC